MHDYEKTVYVYQSIPFNVDWLTEDENILAQAFNNYLDSLPYAPTFGADVPSWDERLLYADQADLGDMVELASLAFSDYRNLGLLPPDEGDELVGLIAKKVQEDLENELGDKAINFLWSGRLRPLSIRCLRGWIVREYGKERHRLKTVVLDAELSRKSLVVIEHEKAKLRKTENSKKAANIKHQAKNKMKQWVQDKWRVEREGYDDNASEFSDSVHRILLNENGNDSAPKIRTVYNWVLSVKD